MRKSKKSPQKCNALRHFGDQAEKCTRKTQSQIDQSPKVTKPKILQIGNTIQTKNLTAPSLDEHEDISCKIHPDSCKKYECLKIFAEKFISCKILADDVNFARILQKT